MATPPTAPLGAFDDTKTPDGYATRVQRVHQEAVRCFLAILERHVLASSEATGMAELGAMSDLRDGDLHSVIKCIAGEFADEEQGWGDASEDASSMYKALKQTLEAVWTTFDARVVGDARDALSTNRAHP